MNLIKQRHFVKLGILIVTLTFLSDAKAQPNAKPPEKETKNGEKDGEKKDQKAEEPKIKEVKKTGSPFKPIVCKSEILKSYGLEGLKESVATPLDVCPSITNSCCAASDQIVIQQTWQCEKGSKRLLERFAYYTTAYSAILDIMTAFSKTVKTYNKRKLLSAECSDLGLAIAAFDVEKVATSLKLLQKQTFAYLEKTFLGTYCSLCNAHYHQYLDPNGLKVTFSDKFCRSFVSNTFHFLIYYYVHLLKPANLMSKMAASCNNNGFYDPKPQVPSEIVMKIDPDIKNSLFTCKSSRDHRNKWMKDCQPICNKINMVNYSAFLEPNVYQFENFTVYLKSRMTEFERPADPTRPESQLKTATPPVILVKETTGGLASMLVVDSATPVKNNIPAQSNTPNAETKSSPTVDKAVETKGKGINIDKKADTQTTDQQELDLKLNESPP
jgi:hypothetical protein